ncbi:hypothetical protein F5Y05DRAFT_411968 [Hypoxylon sp. FL0543]|nr:hypothetical protein F5Y05DRAFT_411968 [Hypoxylon sp. FL0543]
MPNTHGENSSSLDLYTSLNQSGTHNLNRTGYHEEKCRNVLVRYCAHIPRNFQYKDGIQQIFLILREHLGDENLDLAGGVLYELIEVDCEHTDDPGAAFQRWKHDHLRRYADLELPHVPHLTTVTLAIIPTQRLAQWRSQHSSRYPFVLSDSSPSTERASVDPSCIRNRKAWLIDHTLYISSRNNGTRALNRPNPKEFHEMQWNHEYGTQGKFIEERDVPIISPNCPSETSPSKTTETTETLLNTSNQCKGLRRYSPAIGLLHKLVSRVSAYKRKPEVEQKRRSWMPDALVFDTSLFRDKRIHPDRDMKGLLDGFEVPNATFARKHSLLEASDSLPPSVFLSQMPTAESKATDTIVEAATSGLLENASSWSFRGPFTPQLGFDGGLDYQWGLQEPSVTSRRFHVVASTKYAPDAGHDNIFEGSGPKRIRSQETHQRTSTKRQGMILNLGIGGDGDIDMIRQSSSNYTTSNTSISKYPNASIPRGVNETDLLATQHHSALLVSDRVESTGAERNRRSLYRRHPLLFENVEFTTPIGTLELDTPTSNPAAGLQSPMTLAEIEKKHKSSEGCRDRRWAWDRLSDGNKGPEKTRAFADSQHLLPSLQPLPSPLPLPASPPSTPPSLPPSTPVSTSASQSEVFNEEEQGKVWAWLNCAANSNQDPNLLSPFAGREFPPTDYSPVADQSPQSNPPLQQVDAPLPKQYPSSALRQSSLNWPLSQGTSSFSVTQKKVKRVRFTKSTKMDSTPERSRGPAEPDMTRGRAPNREAFCSRAASHSQQSRNGGVLPHYYHGRDNSLTSSRTYQQHGSVPSPERGRSLQRRYEFQSSDSDNALSPVFEGGMDNRQSNVTTMTDIINRAQGDSSQRLQSRSVSRHKSPPKPVGYTSTQLKDKHRPAPLDLEDARRYGTVAAEKSNLHPIHNPVSPIESEMAQAFGDRSSSVYTDGNAFPSYEAPLRAAETSGMGGVNILQGYNDWKENQPVGAPVAVNGYLYSKGTKEHENAAETLNMDGQEFQGQPAKEANSRPSNVDESSKELEEPPFTPLTPYLMNTRVATKTLIGDKGWLEDTAAQAKKPESKKPASFMGNFKKTARKIAEITEFRAGQPKTHTPRELNISLDPREQSLLYCELEFVLSNTLSGYINIQLHSGRLDPHILAKISDAWEQKGRPKVTGFRYDLETQVDMIAAHVGTFRFYGPHQTDQDMIKGLLYGMKMNARVMRVRTYCQPDPVIAKHILDAQALAQLLDSPESVQVPLAEVAQFFKVVIERERDARMKREAEQSFVERAPDAGVMPRNLEPLSPPKGNYPSEYRVKDQAHTQGNFSEPLLEPKVYDPSQSRTQVNAGRQPWHGA